MENRRGKRGGGGTGVAGNVTAATPVEVADPAKSSPKSTTNARASPASKSPSRRSSLSRNRSPARNASPSRTNRSPARNRSPGRPKSTTMQRRSARNKNDAKITDNDTASETDDSKSDIGPKPVMKLRLSPLKLDKFLDKKSTIKGTVTKTSKSITTASSIKVSNITSEGDDEVALLTAKYQQTATDKLNAATNFDTGNNLTPSVSDLSAGKRSYSRSVSRSVLEDEEWSHSDTSEKNDDPLYANRITRSRSKTQGNYLLRREQNLSSDAAAEFGGSIGAVAWMLILSISCFATQYVCSRPECNGKSIRLEKLKLLSTYMSLESGYLYVAYVWAVCLLSNIPKVGIKRQLPQPVASTEPTAQHYFNGLATAITIVGGIAATEYYFKYPINTLIYRNYQQLCFIGIVYSLIISIWCFLRSAYFPVRSWNPYAKSGRLISDLFIGREINPRWLQIIDIKLVHRRISLISTLIFNLIFLTRNVKFAAVSPTVEAPLTFSEIILNAIQNIKFDPIAATLSILIILYVLDALLFEHHLTSSFELQNEGVGAQLLLQYALFPVWTSLIAKFALQNKVLGVPNWLLGIICTIYVSGVLLKRLSNELKYHFRVHPNSNRSIRLETLPTFQGRRLLIAKYWSLIRHPNYLGEIICALAPLPLLYYRFAWPPIIAALYTILLLVHRARRVDSRMSQHYNSAWTRYKSQVRYSFIPRIY